VNGQCLPVRDANSAVHHSEDQQLSIQQLIDASLPSQQETIKGAQTRVRDLLWVRDRHLWRAWPFTFSSYREGWLSTESQCTHTHTDHMLVWW